MKPSRNTEDRAVIEGDVHSVRWGRILAIAAFALICPCLADTIWSRSVELVLLGLLIWLVPPRRSLGATFNVLFVLLFGIAFAAYLPASWFQSAEWRESAARLGIPLGSFVTPQPWLTFDAIVDMFAGVSWAYLLFTQKWSAREHRLLAQVFVFGVLVEIVVAICVSKAGITIPWWINERNFGPFRNRNNTANFFMVGGLLMLGCSYAALRRSRVLSIGWLLGTVVALFGLVLSYSRAGIGLFIVGGILWVAFLGFTSRERKAVAIFAAIGLSLGTLFLIKGGETLERFRLSSNSVSPLLVDLRWAMAKDVLTMTSASPWCGITLGNFTDIFPQFRKASLSEVRALHPDSDWMMVLAEMGWAALLIVVALCCQVLRGVTPLRHGSNLGIRTAALAAAIAFAIHAVVNVSTHTAGTFFPAILGISLALSPDRKLRYSPGVSVVFRSAAVVIGIVGAASLAAFATSRTIPGRLGVQNLKQIGREKYAVRSGATLRNIASVGNAIAPLDWEFYYLRGSAFAFTPGMERFAVEDYRRCRFLFPNSWRIAFQQGRNLLRVAPKLAIEPWTDALNRAADPPIDLYRDMLDLSEKLPEVRQALEGLAGSSWPRRLTVLSHLRQEEFEERLAKYVESDVSLDSLTDEQGVTLFELWRKRGDRNSLLKAVEGRKALLKFAWVTVANDLAEKGDFEGASRTALQFVVRPEIPSLASHRPLPELEKQYVLNKGDFVAGFALASAQKESGDGVSSLSTLTAMSALPGCPPYVYFIAAEDNARASDYAAAWQFLTKYDSRLVIRPTEKRLAE